MRQVHEQVRHERGARSGQRKGVSRRALLGGAAACAALRWALPARADDGVAPFGPWRATLLREHPLVGTIFDTLAERAVSRQVLEQRLRAHAVAILGEVHDNPDHHRIQAALLRAFAEGRKKPPAVVFEMIPADMQRRVDSILRVEGLDADMIFDAVRWDESGWPPRALYRPLMEVVVALKAPVIAAGLPRDQVRGVAREGLGAMLSRKEQEALQLAPLPEPLMNGMVAEIIRSHCDMIPAEVARGMSRVQRLRDALLADGVRAGWRRQGAAVLICGDGHARKDRAVPLYLKRHGDVPAPLVVWQAEAQEEARTVAALLPEDAQPPARVADVIIVTPKAEREDPCKRFERFMRRKRKHGRQ